MINTCIRQSSPGAREGSGCDLSDICLRMAAVRKDYLFIPSLLMSALTRVR